MAGLGGLRSAESMAPATRTGGSVVGVMRRPDPPPLESNDVRTVLIGTTAWAIALVALLPFYDTLERDGRLWLLWMCGCGIALGGVGVYYCRRRARAIARDAALDAAANAPD